MTWRPNILELDWDDRNVEHVERHISAALIDDLIEGGDWFAFRNYRGTRPSITCSSVRHRKASS